jgi:hypothetical protein
MYFEQYFTFYLPNHPTILFLRGNGGFVHGMDVRDGELHVGCQRWGIIGMEEFLVGWEIGNPSRIRNCDY